MIFWGAINIAGERSPKIPYGTKAVKEVQRTKIDEISLIFAFSCCCFFNQVLLQKRRKKLTRTRRGKRLHQDSNFTVTERVRIPYIAVFPLLLLGRNYNRHRSLKIPYGTIAVKLHEFSRL